MILKSLVAAMKILLLAGAKTAQDVEPGRPAGRFARLSGAEHFAAQNLF